MRESPSIAPALAASMLLAAVLALPARAAPMEHDHIVNVLTYSADGKTILSGSWDQTVRLWDAATGKEIRRLAGQASGVDCEPGYPSSPVVYRGSCRCTIHSS